MKYLYFIGLIQLLLINCLEAQINWEHTNGPEGGGVYQIQSNSKYAFCEDNTFLYRTSDNQKWEKLPFFDAYPFAVGENIIVTTRSGPEDGKYRKSILAYSFDDGNTWKEGLLPIPNEYYTDIAISSHGIYVLESYDQGKIYHTKDFGSTWDTINTPLPYTHNLKAYDDKIFIELNDGVYEFNQLSGVFARIYTIPNNENILSYAIYDNSIFINNGNSYIAWSHDYGSTWSSINVGSNNGYLEFVKINDGFYFLAGNGLFYKPNINSPWGVVYKEEGYSINNLCAFKNELLISSYSFGCLKFDPIKKDVLEFNTGRESGGAFQLKHFNGKLWASTNLGIFNYENEKWNKNEGFKLPYDYRYKFNHIKTNNKKNIAISISYEDSIYVSNDYGQSWLKSNFNDFENWNSCYLFDATPHWLGDNLIITQDRDPCAKITTDYGVTWKDIDVCQSITEFKGEYYSINYEDLQKSMDEGLTWTKISFPHKDLAGIASTKDKLFAFTQTFGQINDFNLYTSEDGLNWNFSSDGIQQKRFYNFDYEPIIPIEYNGLYFIFLSHENSYVSIDSCQTWIPYDAYNIPTLVVDSIMYKARAGVFKAKVPNFKGQIVSGNVYYDKNKNQLKDANEIPIPGYKIYISNIDGEDKQVAYSSSIGKYSSLFYNEKPIIIKPSADISYFEKAFPESIVIDSAASGLDIGIQLKSDITDIGVSGILNNRARPGFERKLFIKAVNNGSISSQGNLGIKLDKSFKFTNSIPPPTQKLGSDSLNWEFNGIDIFDEKRVIIEGYIDSFATLGAPFEIKGYFETTNVDQSISNNHYSIKDTIVGSYDPNEKTVSPVQGLTKEEIADGQELVYTIYFQNTGTYQADRVRITDKIDTALNIQTLRILDASHRITKVDLLPGQLLQFIFDNIALPDSNANEPQSHGFVSFAIQRNKAFRESHSVPNNAAIYFDFNQPIITNTTISPVYKPSIISSTFDLKQENEKLTFSPNPATDLFQIFTPKRWNGKGKVDIYNNIGQMVNSLQFDDITKPIIISTTDLSSGIYSIHLKTNKGQSSGQITIIK